MMSKLGINRENTTIVMTCENGYQIRDDSVQAVMLFEIMMLLKAGAANSDEALGYIRHDYQAKTKNEESGLTDKVDE